MQANITVLIVDDNFLFRETLREIMCMVYPNWRIVEASNGLEGVELAQAYNPDLIFLDFHMPIMNGYDLASALQKKLETNSIPLILMTSDDMGHPLVARLRTLCQGVLYKPFSLKELERIVERVMSPKAVTGFPAPSYTKFPVLEAIS
jgi:CheY-like chemotaxis protein